MSGNAMPSETTAESPAPAHASTGLTSAEVPGLRKQFGFNDIPEEKKHPLLKFLGYFWGPNPWMIEIAAILSAVISHWEDFAIILLLLVTNAVVGFFQERKAENAIELLKKQLAPNARVLRDGKWQEIPARELVPGDLVHIRLGDSDRQIAKSFEEAAKTYAGNPTALHLRGMNMLYEWLKTNNSVMILIPSPVLNTMGLGDMTGIIALGQNQKKATGDNSKDSPE